MSAYDDAKFQVRRAQRKLEALKKIGAVRTNSIGERQVVPTDLFTKIAIYVRESKRALLKGGAHAGIPCLELDLQKVSFMQTLF
ncbi:hypothetical protein Ciccas_000226 [Cichlidogyrus casuarinus]|uniref:Uncharacterized protein n=1 Tax=Cichlidogyrus casuarinus TaxID=1844966 RepID=A0ABD2QNL1_9PLAT